MELDIFDSSGRRKPVEKTSDTFLTSKLIRLLQPWARKLIPHLSNGTGPRTFGRKTIAVNRANGQTSVHGCFSGGDAASGPSSVIEAIAAGEHAAVGIDSYLTGESHAFWRQERDSATGI